MIGNEYIESFCNDRNYDIRLTKSARWIDQKCTPDVVFVIADCIMNYIEQNGEDVQFSISDIWHFDYTVQNIEDIFRKPGVENQMATSEYDKFFAQPIEMMYHAGVLSKEKIGRKNYYSVNDIDILEYLSFGERNALAFLQIYILKVLTDSNLMPLFEAFFNDRNKETFDDMKTGFEMFIINNTPINTTVECRRIFTKVLNPLAFSRRCEGTERGRMSNNRITYDMLMYNRNNFMDIISNKPKEMTRREYLENNPLELNDAYYRLQSNRAKAKLRRYNDEYRNSESEVHGEAGEQATHIHHIFPYADYPEISYFLENLIALTPTQHLNHAHPLGVTTTVDIDYQQTLLLAKNGQIYENINDDSLDTIYDFENFLFVLATGFDNDEYLDIESMNFIETANAINSFFAGRFENNQEYDFVNRDLAMVADDTLELQ